MVATRILTGCLALGVSGLGQAKPESAEDVEQTSFVYPCEKYRAGLRGRGNFGVLIPRRKGSVFGGTWHLAEDVWLPGGTEVCCVADGVVVYSDFSPTWTDAKGHKHWNFGNVIVIEHALGESKLMLGQANPLKFVCSVYVHLGKQRLVKRGDLVQRGQRIATIGADRSEENGYYPAHLHFGIHRGPYHQLSPAWRRLHIAEAKAVGLPVADGGDRGMRLVRGEVVEVKVTNETTVVSTFATGDASVMSLEVGSTSPGYKPADIMGWCEGYGDEKTVAEWLRPSSWIEARLPEKPAGKNKPEVGR